MTPAGTNKIYDNKATVKYSGPKSVFTNRQFFQLVRRIKFLSCNVPLLSIEIGIYCSHLTPKDSATLKY